MKNDDIEMAYKFNSDDDSMSSYEIKMNDIILKRISVLKELSSNEWNDFSNSIYELFNAYAYLVDAYLLNGFMSKALKVSKEAIEYCEIYRKYIDSKSLYKYSSKFSEVIKTYDKA